VDDRSCQVYTVTHGFRLPLERRFQDIISTDPRDKVFAMLGMATDADSPELQPDYEVSPQTVFPRAAYHVKRSLRVLTAAGRIFDFPTPGSSSRGRLGINSQVTIAYEPH